MLVRTENPLGAKSWENLAEENPGFGVPIPTFLQHAKGRKVVHSLQNSCMYGCFLQTGFEVRESGKQRIARVPWCL